MEMGQEKKQLTDTVEGFITKAYHLLDQENYLASREIFHELLKKLPNQPNCLFGLAIIYHKQNNWNEAKRILYRLIEKFPNSSPAVDTLSKILLEENQLEEAKYFFEKNLVTESTNPYLHRNLGYLYQRMQQYEKAITYFQNALALKPDYAECLIFLGYIAEKINKPKDAARFYEKAIELNPNSSPGAIGLGRIALCNQNLTEAHSYFDKALAELMLDEQPENSDEYAQAFLQLARHAIEQKHDFLAQISLETMIKLQPHHATGFIALGDLYKNRKEYTRAKKCYEEALSIDSRSQEALNQLGNTLVSEHRYGEARHCFEKLLRIEPHHMVGQLNLAVTHDYAGEWKEAEQSYSHILKAYEKVDFASDATQRRNYATTRFNLSLIQLRNRNYQEGWANYQFRKNILPMPYLEGIPKLTSLEKIEGKKIVILNDQGLGDMLQFIRFCRLLKAGGAHVYVSTCTELVSILQSCPYIDKVNDYVNLPELADHTQLLITDIPFYAKLNEKNFLADTPYLFTSEEKSHEVDTYLFGTKRLKVGVCYRGNRYRDTQRLIRLETLAPLLRIPDIDFYDLVVQSPFQREALNELHVLQEHLQDFSDLAGVINKLDLVISIDTAVAHLVGAMHKPGWVLLPRTSDWRWQEERSDSPWYPSLKLYRQNRAGEWDAVLRQIHHDLSKL